MKDEPITYILNGTIVHYSVGARGHSTHEDGTTHVPTGSDFQQAEIVLCNNIT
jgi:hypothetical protein